MPGTALIALLISPASWSNRLLLEGITAYARRNARWRFVLQEFTAPGTVDKWVLRARPAGVIAEITSRRMARSLQQLAVPIVDILEEHPVPHVPQIVCNDQKIVQRAIDHLLDKGLRHLAFVGERDRHFANQRRRWFCDHALRRYCHDGISERDAKAMTAVAMLPASGLLPDGLVSLTEWLDGLPKPLGVVACNDEWGAQILRACAERGLHVPDDVAVIGVNDDPIFCQMSDPPLSSIGCHSKTIGYKAAAVLHGMISREAFPPPITFIDPGAVHERGSSDIVAIPDKDAAAAIRFLRDRACAGFSPARVAQKLGISRRTLERMFTRHVGHSPAMEISRVRLERVREFLACTDLPVADIARRAGIRHVETLHRVFKRQFGLTPGGYRTANGLQDRSPGRRRRSRAGIRQPCSPHGKTCMSRPLRIALIVPPMSWYGRLLIAGITAYSREHGPWRFVLQTDTGDNRVESWVRRWKPDGVLARITGPRMAAELRQLGVPVVDLLEESGRSRIPRIVCDDEEVVRRAVDHLFERHLRNFAYVGRQDVYFSRQRRSCFREYIRLRQRLLKAAGESARLTSADVLLPWESMPHLRVELAEWIGNLPKPIGIVACNDVWAAQVLRVCSEYDFRVPDDIAVIGIDDDPVMCQLSTPTLSSVDVNAHSIGYRAAAMLEGMIVQGESHPPVTFVEPGPVRPRVSTDTLAIADPIAAAAVRYLRAHACEKVTPAKAATALGISRRTLERLFLSHVGHAPAVEITRARLDRARDLLIETDLTVSDVAERTGFFHAETLCRIFKKNVGVTPGEYRRAHGPKTATIVPPQHRSQQKVRK